MCDINSHLFKLEIFIPETHLGQLQTVLQEVDAGHIGNYDSCLSFSRVIGTWRPLSGSSSYIGEAGMISEEEELKVEVSVNGDRLKETISAIRRIHPYEEPVIYVIPLYQRKDNDMEALEAIKTRRSTRKMKSDIPERSLIEQVIEAGRYGPSGSNSQTTHFIVFTKKELLAELAELVQNEFAAMELQPDMYISLKNSISAARTGNYAFHYNAPVLIVTANKKGYGNAIADSACALENMMIAANALDLGSCWINQLHWLDENEGIRSFLKSYGLQDDETITGGLILGYPESGMPERKPLERKGNPVTWV